MKLSKIMVFMIFDLFMKLYLILSHQVQSSFYCYIRSIRITRDFFLKFLQKNLEVLIVNLMNLMENILVNFLLQYF